MKKNKAKKYFFNRETLKYQEYKPSAWTNFKRGFYFLTSSLAIAVTIVFIANIFFDSPKEMALERDLDQLKLNYQILNDRLVNIDNVLADLEDRDDNIYRIIFEAEPIPASIRKAGYGGADRYAKLEGYSSSDIMIKATKKLDEITGKLYIQSKSFDEVYELAKAKSTMLASLPAIQPVNSKSMKRISSYFGNRPDPYYKVTKFHAGIDFSAPIGTPIYATGDGVINKVRKSNSGYGYYISIDHGFGYETVYAHCHEFKAKKGDKVKRGQIIATVGNTGKSTGPHVHYEIRKKGRPINPIHYFYNDLTPEEYDEILVRSTLPSQSMD
ncbi:MAG: M23 family metallopeptidase [Hyphomicrobiales bacterium]